ncbi:MAG: ATP-binding protein [Halobacteriaceae archaeon]
MIKEETIDGLHRMLKNEYSTELSNLCQGWPREKQSLTIEYSDLFSVATRQAEKLTTEPMDTIEDLRYVAMQYDYPVDKDIEPEVRIQGSEYERAVEQLRRTDVGKYLTVRGRVNQLTQVEPKPVIAAYTCLECGTTVKKDVQWSKLQPPSSCDTCEGQRQFKLDEAKTTFEDHQLVELSALPEDIGGQTSDTIQVELTNDLCGQLSPGDQVKISGIVKTEQEDIVFGDSPDARRSIYLDGWAIQSEQESFSEIEPTQLEEIQELAERDDIYRLLTNSFAPHINTTEEGNKQKLALMLALFGGVQKQLDTGSQIRGNINVLLIGDAGTAKSQYLQTIDKIAPKSVKASGKGATPAGLTASAEQSNLTGEWTLKAGALVLANNGIASIDEFDKLPERARKSIHEAMENQEVPVNKAGINTTLPAKTAVIAAANPKDGDFNRYDDASEQLGMEQPLITRFDLIFPLYDTVDEERDREIAETQHDVAAGEGDFEPDIEYDLLREYIAYARQIEPTYESESVKDTLIDFYVDMRQKSKEESGSPIGPRVNDSLRRLAQASARIRLSDSITMADAERAIEFMKYTISQIALDEDGNLSGNQYNGGQSKPTTQQERMDHVKDLMRKLERENGDGPGTPYEKLTERARIESREVDKVIDNLMQKGEIYEPETDHYATT